MSGKKQKFLFGALMLATSHLLCGQTIAEKKAGLKSYMRSDLSPEMQQLLEEFQDRYLTKQEELENLYKEANVLYAQHAPEYAYRDLLVQIKAVKEELNQLENSWRQAATDHPGEPYALWHQPSTTLEQLVIDYGAQDYVYLIPPEIANITVSVNSSIPIPRVAWNEMLELILTQNGVGIKQLNPYLRQLILLSEDRSGLKLITNRRQDLMAFPSNERIAFVLSPEPADVRRSWFFLEKFVNPNSTVLQRIGRDILIVGQVSEIQELLRLYDFVSSNQGDKEYKAVTLSRVDADEMSRILSAIFGGLTEGVALNCKEPKGGGPLKPNGGPQGFCAPQDNSGDNGLRVIPLSHVARAVFLIGTRQEICKAERIIRDVENQVGEARGKIIYWYTTKHSDPDELADVLERIYNLMVTSGIEAEEACAQVNCPRPLSEVGVIEAPPIRRPYDDGYYLDDRFVVNKPMAPTPKEVNAGRENFIVDPKSSAIVMVVEADILPKLKDLIKKLDIPKKMVQIEVLLFEKNIHSRDNLSLNLLLGDAASNTNLASVIFNNTLENAAPGIFEFLFSRKAHNNTPAYDIAYRFLISQDDIRINENPSVLALNQTPAVIEIAEEISVSTGIYQVETTSGDVALKDSFSRAQYGIKIEVTPTIHTQDEFSEEGDYVTLSTDITFQTIRNNINSRPDVITRHVINEVRIPDGQTVILGGLRQKTSQDHTDSIPFLGELPGIGKLFSSTTMRDDSTEMFLFLTPKIVNDPAEDLRRIRRVELCRRPGDIPAFLCRLVAAEEWERTHVVQGSLMLFLGRPDNRCLCPPWEYDWR